MKVKIVIEMLDDKTGYIVSFDSGKKIVVKTIFEAIDILDKNR